MLLQHSKIKIQQEGYWGWCVVLFGLQSKLLIRIRDDPSLLHQSISSILVVQFYLPSHHHSKVAKMSMWRRNESGVQNFTFIKLGLVWYFFYLSHKAQSYAGCVTCTTSNAIKLRNLLREFVWINIPRGRRECLQVEAKCFSGISLIVHTVCALTAPFN